MKLGFTTKPPKGHLTPRFIELDRARQLRQEIKRIQQETAQMKTKEEKALAVFPEIGRAADELNELWR